jgi:putative protease
MVEKKLVGKISHFFPKISVAVLDLEGTISVGDTISIESPVGAFEQQVDSMQIEHENVEQADAGQSIGLKVVQATKEGSKVYKVIE